MKTRIAAITLLVLFAMSFDTAADTTIRVVPLASTLTPFKCGDRCKFRAAVPSSAIRLRIFRGTIADLSKTGTDRRYVGTTGCVEYYSMIVRPRHPRRANVLDLRFYFMPKWLNGNRDGRFVFVVEHDDRPNGPQVEERPAMLRLPAKDTDEYFRSGMDITVRAPLYKAVVMAKPAMTPAGGSEMAMTVGDEDAAPAPAPVPVPREATTSAAANDCITLQFDPGAPVVIRNADAREPRRGNARLIAP